MNKKPTKKQLEKFWKWCGFKKYEYDTTGVVFHIIEWINPKGTHQKYLPNLDLNSLFLYAMPKLKEE